MSEITHREVDAHLQTRSGKKTGEGLAPVYLIFGEEFICQSVFEKILDAIVPPERRELNCELLDEAQTSVFELVERLTTYSMMPGPKVVALPGFTDFQRPRRCRQNSGQGPGRLRGPGNGKSRAGPGCLCGAAGAFLGGSARLTTATSF